LRSALPGRASCSATQRDNVHTGRALSSPCPWFCPTAILADPVLQQRALEQEIELKERVQRFWADELGAEAVEWAAVTAALLVMTVPVILILRSSMLELFRQAFTAVQKPPEPDYP